MTLTTNIPQLHYCIKLPSWLCFQMLSSDGCNSWQLYICSKQCCYFIHRSSGAPVVSRHLLS